MVEEIYRGNPRKSYSNRVICLCNEAFSKGTHDLHGDLHFWRNTSVNVKLVSSNVAILQYGKHIEVEKTSDLRSARKALTDSGLVRVASN